MPWYDEAVFYHIYPLGLLGAPKQNDYGEPQHRLAQLVPWLDHLQRLGVTALYIGPLFQSVGHGYETTDYRCVDSRLGTNDDLRNLVSAAHDRGIRVVFDGVFNHVGRDFFAYQDLIKRREESPYRDWFVNVNFGGNNSFGDGVSYETWGGYDHLIKLNQRNGQVVQYLCDVVRFWVAEFDVDGIRLDAADVLDFDFMHALRQVANEVKPDFWLMGEVIHGEYSRWVNGDTLHAVTNYSLHKALYSGHNDHNYFEIAHTVKRNYDMGGDRVDASTTLWTTTTSTAFGPSLPTSATSIRYTSLSTRCLARLPSTTAASLPSRASAPTGPTTCCVPLFPSPTSPILPGLPSLHAWAGCAMRLPRFLTASTASWPSPTANTPSRACCLRDL